MQKQASGVSLPPSVLNGLLGLSHAEKLVAAQVLLREIAAEEGITQKTPQTSASARRMPAFDWEGGLSELELSSVDLQKKALEWR